MSRRPGEQVASFFFSSWIKISNSTLPVLTTSHFNDYLSFSELQEDINLNSFLNEYQATLAKRGKESVAWVIGELWDYLQ